MESVLGGGVLLAVAAALWLIYLVPNWLRRREFIATERNAVRLQQTIRVLAETAETPQAIRIENAAKARAIAATLKDRPVAVGTTPTLPLPEELDPRAIALRRLRRTRLVTTIFVLAAAAVLLMQVWTMIAGGMAAGSPIIILAASACLFGGLGLQARLTRIARARAATPAAQTQPRRSIVVPDIALDVADSRATTREWTPTKLPVPMSQLRRQQSVGLVLDDAQTASPSRGAAPAGTTPAEVAQTGTHAGTQNPAAVARAAALAAAEIAAAQQAAEAALRRRQDEVPAATPGAGVPAGAGVSAAAGVPEQTQRRSQSRWASMGVVEGEHAVLDLDAAIRRRRAS